MVDVNTRLGVERTRLAHERTLMAWVRTSTSLISFGFTIYKAFQYLVQNTAATADRHWLTPRIFALAMITLGVAALILATIQHVRDVRSLEHEFGPASRSVSALVASIVALLGCVALILVAAHQ
jgi:putative membrane protein